MTDQPCEACGQGRDPDTGVALHTRWCRRPVEVFPPAGAVSLALFRRRSNVLGHNDRKLNEQLCAFCLVLPGTTREHFIPRSRGGDNTDANVVPACALCNRLKDNATVFEWFPRLQRRWRTDARYRSGPPRDRFARRLRERQQQRPEAGGRRFIR